MSSREIPRALLRKASHHLKDARQLRTSGDLGGSADNLYRSMLAASEALLYLHGKAVKQPDLIVAGVRTSLVDEDLFPEEAYAWLRETHDFMGGGAGPPPLDEGRLEDLEDRAEKYFITVESMLL